MIELAGLIILGILAQWLAWRTRVPAILPLILIGLLVGPLSTLWTEGGEKIIQPVFDGHRGLFPDKSMLFYFVSLSIGIILFEGGLTLKRSEIKNVGSAITKLILVGSLVTFIGAAIAAYFCTPMDWKLSFLFAGLIIVTGPTVIAPILRNVPLSRNVATVLKWEGILIDPLGALVAVLVFEFIQSGGGHGFTIHALQEFGMIVAVGFTYGVLAALFLSQMIKREWIPHYLLNVFTLALVLLVFAGSDLIAHESGLLSVVVMGMVLGNLDVHGLKDILYFKESLSVLLISMLFILLSANIDIAQLQLLDWNSALLFAVVVLLIRPLGVFLSTFNSNLSLQEKLFISWVGPRGIVAAGIASLFGIQLTNEGVPGAELITPLVFMIVLGTVLLNATTARLVAKWLGVTLDKSDGILIVGAHEASRLIARYLTDNGRHVALVDRNERNVKKSKEEGLEAIQADIYADDLQEHFELLDVGFLFAMTGSEEVNVKACKKYSKDFGENGTFRLLSPDEMRKPQEELPKQGIFSYRDDFLNINEVVRDFPEIHEIPTENEEEFLDSLNGVIGQVSSVPLFIKEQGGGFLTIPSDISEVDYKEGMVVVYLGKELE